MWTSTPQIGSFSSAVGVPAGWIAARRDLLVPVALADLGEDAHQHLLRRDLAMRADRHFQPIEALARPAAMSQALAGHAGALVAGH